MKFRYLLSLFSILAFAVIVAGGAACIRPTVPSPATVEAGVDGVNGVCTFLEGVTENQTVISICATVEEIAFIASILAPFLVRNLDGGTCKVVQGTSLCVTPLDLGRAIQTVLARRRALLLLEGGVP